MGSESSLSICTGLTLLVDWFWFWLKFRTICFIIAICYNIKRKSIITAEYNVNKQEWSLHTVSQKLLQWLKEMLCTFVSVYELPVFAWINVDVIRWPQNDTDMEKALLWCDITTEVWVTFPKNSIVKWLLYYRACLWCDTACHNWFGVQYGTVSK